MRRRVALILLLVLPGIIVMAMSGYFALLDWVALRDAYARFREVRASDARQSAVFAAWAAQDIHRTNLAADGTWFLLGGVIFAIGVHGLCVLPREDRPQADNA
ncbi:MAG: hypothetical protein AB7Y46_05440 [Armatimonadota bacterium]